MEWKSPGTYIDSNFNWCSLHLYYYSFKAFFPFGTCLGNMDVYCDMKGWLCLTACAMSRVIFLCTARSVLEWLHEAWFWPFDNVATLIVVLTLCNFQGVSHLLISVMLAALNTKQLSPATVRQVLGNSFLRKQLHLVEPSPVCKSGLTERGVKCQMRAVLLVACALPQSWALCPLVICA